MFANRNGPVVAAAALLASSFACGGAVQDELGADAAGLSTRTLSFVVVRPDVRRCAAPMCGGFWVHDANKAASTEQYVSALDFDSSGLDDASVEHVLNTSANELVLKARLSAQDARSRTRRLVVAEAYRGLPGMAVAAGDAFFSVVSRNLRCVAAPCNTLGATRLGASSKTGFARLEVGPAARPLVDTRWLSGRVTAHGALVAAHFEAGQRMAAGTEKVLEASQVFVKLPEAIGPCPMFAGPPCGAGETMTFQRNADRCTVPAGCVKVAACPHAMPACGAGYTLQSWPAGATACAAFACDPTFAAP